ncbi:thioredoxin reductase [Phytophthora pseudosyringae]|uniref:Thioredoxin reductase n=1 Tax=Phytophthora pseudosyringae TaxID=221518 RepID=A0A8T1WC16_9STRA|nr:thioredoxin reductase [Phytophthora pseudosyringae]
MPTLAVASTLSSFALLASTAEAHQIVLLPEPQWTTTDKDTKYNPLAFLENQGFKTQEDFAAWRSENNYKSLRDFMDNAKYTVTDGADLSCGFTDPKGTPQPIPDGNAMRSTGYTHDGPCEVWLDDTMVLDGENCHEKFPGKDYTVDYSSCKGTCTLRWYWLGIRFLKNAYSWQVYKECIPLSGSGGGATKTTPTTAPSGSGMTTPTTASSGSGMTTQATPSPESPATDPPTIWGSPSANSPATWGSTTWGQRKLRN